MRTRLHHELDRLLTSGCSWCMAESLDGLRPLLEQLQQAEWNRGLEEVVEAELERRNGDGDDGQEQEAA